jgi:hypothetical protein
MATHRSTRGAALASALTVCAVLVFFLIAVPYLMAIKPHTGEVKTVEMEATLSVDASASRALPDAGLPSEGNANSISDADTIAKVSLISKDEATEAARISLELFLSETFTITEPIVAQSAILCESNDPANMPFWFVISGVDTLEYGSIISGSFVNALTGEVYDWSRPDDFSWRPDLDHESYRNFMIQKMERSFDVDEDLDTDRYRYDA